MSGLLTWVKRSPWTLFLMAPVILAVAVFVGRADVGLADVKDDFEIDAEECTAVGCTEGQATAANHAGIVAGEDDWATLNAIPNGIDGNGTDNGADDCQTPPADGLPQPAFLLCNGDRAPGAGAPGLVEDCYGSEIIPNSKFSPEPVFICDGNSSGQAQVELDIVSSFTNCSDQKTNESLGYVVIGRQVVCPGGDQHFNPATGTFVNGPAGDHNHDFVLGAYHRLSNSGTMFAGFIFAQKPPAFTPQNIDADGFAHNAILGFVTFVINGFVDVNSSGTISATDDGTVAASTGRTAGDVLVLLNQSGQNVIMQFSQATNVGGVPVYPAPTTAPASTDPCGSLAA